MSTTPDKVRVLIVCIQPLLCEGIYNLLAENETMDIVGPVALEQALSLLERQPVDVVVLAGEKATAEHSADFKALLDHLPHTPIIQTKLSKRTLQLYMVQEVPASTDALFHALRALSRRSSFLEIPE